MNYLKQFGKIIIFPAVFLFIFSVFGNTIVFADNVGDKCGAGSKGICRYPSSVNDGCDPDKERKSGECSSYSVQLNCCVPKETAPADNSDCLNLQCGNAHGQCFPNSCGDLEEKGTCTGTPPGGGKNVCCLPKNCAATNPATPSSGSASLDYTPLENLPGFEGESGDFASYFKNLYLLALWIVGISALFMLVVGGFLYLSSAGNTSLLGTAKKTIYGALIGLVIALISWLLLNTINADLTNLKLSGLSGAVGGSSGTSTATTPPSGDADPEGCKKLKNLSVNQSQCNLASKELVQMLSCMEGKGISNKWTSISANAVGGDQNKAIACCGAGKTASCPHSSVTCHHGCTYGTKGLSYAIDIGGTSGASDATLCAIASAAKSCGGGNIWGPRTLSCGIKEQDGHNSHLHVSVSGCPH